MQASVDDEVVRWIAKFRFVSAALLERWFGVSARNVPPDDWAAVAATRGQQSVVGRLRKEAPSPWVQNWVWITVSSDTLRPCPTCEPLGFAGTL
jgi:hypothetical protein